VKIALVTSTVPFVYGGARNIVSWLKTALEEAGHEVEVVALPFDEEPSRIVEQLGMFRMIDLTDQADLVVCFRPPAYLVQHPRKILWFIHHLRAYYDLWDTEYRGFSDNAIARARRELIQRVDNRAFAEASHIFTNSAVVSSRLREFNGVDSEVLYPPLGSEHSFSNNGYGNEVVAVSRLEHHKRQHLLIEALALTSSKVHLRLVGKGSMPGYGKSLLDLGARLGVADRLHVHDEWVDEDLKQQLLGDALVAAYIPVDEDSYGYPTLEAARATKGVLTTTDSGGVLELVEDGRSGLVVEPTAGALAEAMDRLYLDRELAAHVGNGAADRVDELGISWAHVVDRILSV